MKGARHIAQGPVVESPPGQRTFRGVPPDARHGTSSGSPFAGAKDFPTAACTVHKEYLGLLPEVEARGLVDSLTVMSEEHGELCRLLNGIQDRISRIACPGRNQYSLNAVCSLLEGHAFKKKRVPYASADRLLGTDKHARVLQRMGVAKPLEGWGLPCGSQRVLTAVLRVTVRGRSLAASRFAWRENSIACGLCCGAAHCPN